MQPIFARKPSPRAHYALPEGIPALQTGLSKKAVISVVAALSLVGTAGYLIGRQAAESEIRSQLSGTSKHVTIPAMAEHWDAPTLEDVPGLTDHSREQILIDESHLAELVGREITGIWLRRDARARSAFRGGRVRMTIELSASSADANAPSRWFRDNVPDGSSLVFDDFVVIPESPVAEEARWFPEHTIRMPFHTPFKYAGGTLVVDMMGWPSPDFPGVFWAVDTDSLLVEEPKPTFGDGCGDYQLEGSIDGPRFLGATIMFGSWGAPGTLAMLMIGGRLNDPIELGVMGAPGCYLLVRPDVRVFCTFSGAAMSSSVGGVSVYMQIPSWPELLGSRIWAQWVNFESSLPRSEWSNRAGITTSNAFELVLGTYRPTLGVSTVRSDHIVDGTSPPPTGWVATNRGPVIRFLYR